MSSQDVLPSGVVAIPCSEVMWTRSASAISAAIRCLPETVEVWYDWCQLPVIEKRNYLVSKFLKSTEFEWMIFLDSDMVPQSSSLIELAKAGQEQSLDVLAAHCFTRHGVPYRPCGGWFEQDELSWLEPEDLDGEIHEVDWVGTGCVYLSRRLLEQMVQLRGQGQVFRAEAGREWTGRGEDQEFCRSAGAVGFKLHYHTGIAVGHLGLTNVDDSFVQRIDQTGDEPVRVNCITEAKAP